MIRREDIEVIEYLFKETLHPKKQIKILAELYATTSGLNNLATKVYAFVNDDYALRSPNTPMVDFTINRFRAPLASIAKIEREETTATISVQAMDTGYASPQNVAQIDSIHYRLDPASDWTQATGITWTGLTGQFVIPNLIQNDGYPLQIVVVNAPPAGTTLSSLSSMVVAGTILPFSPALFIYRDSDGATGVAMKKVIIGEDFTVPVTPGSAVIQHDLNVGRDADIGGVLNVGTLLTAYNATFGWCVAIDGQDVHVVRPAGFYMGSNMAHAPDADWWYYIYLPHNELWCTVMAFPLRTNSPPQYKSCINGAWTGWI